VTASTWTLKGTLMIACNCDYGCPCNVNGRPTTGKCEGGWTWHIESGSYGTTALDELNFSIFADWPGAIHEGGGQAISFMDERADDSQRRALTELAQGRAGGPWGLFATTYQRVTALAPTKPFMIGEFASSEVGGNKAAWITDAASRMQAAYPQLRAFVWFNYNKETDWRVESSPASVAAFKTAFVTNGNFVWR